ncbi:MAG: hypothetical protein QM768_00710 [Agriterribacter sp.]
MIFLDILNCTLTFIVIYLTSVSENKKNTKKKSVTTNQNKNINRLKIILAISLVFQIIALFVNKNERERADIKINELGSNLSTYKLKIDTAIAQRDTTIQLAKKAHRSIFGFFGKKWNSL